MLKIKSLFRANGLFLILFWLFLCFNPELALNIVIIVFGIEVLLSWVIGMIFSRQQKQYPYRGLLFFGALLWIIFWILLLIFPQIGHFMVSLMVVLLWITIVVKGIATVFDGFRAKEAQLSTRWLQFVMGGFAILVGFFLITNAFISFILLNILFGTSLVLSGVMILILGFQVKGVKTETLDYEE